MLYSLVMTSEVKALKNGSNKNYVHNEITNRINASWHSIQTSSFFVSFLKNKINYNPVVLWV
jgi:hypothetical protein